MIGGIDGYVTLITDESSRFRVVDHDAKELQVTVDIFEGREKKLAVVSEFISFG